MDEILEKRLQQLKENVNTIKKRMKNFPKDYLRVKKIKGHFYYYIVDANTHKQRYVRLENIDEAKQIAQRDYDYNYLKLAEKEIEEIEKMLSKKYSLRREACYSDLHEGRKQLVMPFELSKKEYIKRWMSIPFQAKEFAEHDATEYYTDRGERVRSKSEVIIANMLNGMEIPYKYECPLQLDTITVYPDFTILDVKERREKYLEHFGMMGNLDYVANMILKMSTYERNQIFLGDGLLCTFESEKRPLNINILRNKLKRLVGEK